MREVARHGVRGRDLLCRLEIFSVFDGFSMMLVEGEDVEKNVDRTTNADISTSYLRDSILFHLMRVEKATG